MDVDLEGQVYELLSLKNPSSTKENYLKSYRLFLEGFDSIVDRSIINIDRLDDAIESATKKNPEFTKIFDIEFYNKYSNLINNHCLISKYIPVDDKFHLAFWVWKLNQDKNSEEGVIFYSPIKTDFVKDKKLPMIDLRVSGNYIKFIPETVKLNDSRHNVLNSFYTINDSEILLKSYDVVSYLMNYSKVDTED